MTLAIQPLRTRRLDVALAELSIDAAVRLAGIPPHRHQVETSEFLSAAVKSARAPTPRHQADPRAWTVQERMLVVCHYLASTSDVKDFPVGDGRYSDYLMHDVDYPSEDNVKLGSIDEADWTMRPLLGAEAEAIEAIEYEAGERKHFHWIKAAMAAQLRRAGEEPRPDAVTDFADYVTWLRQRMRIIGELGESTFSELMSGWLQGQQALQHFFVIEFNSNGALAMPVSETAANAQPARFLARSCLSELAQRLGNQSHQPRV